MSFAEIKESIPRLSPDEQLEIAALIAHLSRAEDPAYQAELNRRMTSMDAGKKHGPDVLDGLNRRFSSPGN